MTEQRAATQGATLSGTVVDVDYDADTIEVELDGGQRQTYPFELFDGGDVYRSGQRFELSVDETGTPASVTSAAEASTAATTVSGYVESVDVDDELVWVYIRSDEGWQRKVMPLSLFEDMGLDGRGVHFLLDLDEHGTPLALRPDEEELEMLPQAVEETKPRWTSRPAAEAEPES